MSMRMRVGCTCGSQNQPIHVKALSAEAEVAGKEEFNLQLLHNGLVCRLGGMQDSLVCKVVGCILDRLNTL